MTPASSRPIPMGLMRAYGMLFTLLTAIALLVWQPAHAQLRVDISGTGATQYPVAIADFAVDDAHGKAIADVIRADLTRTGQFRLINASGAGLNVDSQVNFDDWRTKGADFIAYGSVTRGADGRFDVRYRLGDTIKKGPARRRGVLGHRKGTAPHCAPDRRPYLRENHRRSRRVLDPYCLRAQARQHLRAANR